MRRTLTFAALLMTLTVLPPPGTRASPAPAPSNVTAPAPAPETTTAPASAPETTSDWAQLTGYIAAGLAGLAVAAAGIAFFLQKQQQERQQKAQAMNAGVPNTTDVVPSDEVRDFS